MVDSCKVVVIGLDGATFDLIDPWIAEGKLPTLAELLRSGAGGALRSTIPHHSGPAWTSFATGLGPGKHSIYSFFHRDYGSYTYPPVNSRFVRGETLWHLLGRTGKTVGVMNVPGTFPPMPVNGFMITGMLSPNIESAFYPPDLREKVLRQAPEYSVEAIPLADKMAYLDKAKRSIEARTQAALYLLREHSPDLFVAVFTELDRLQHFFWADMDPEHPSHSPETDPELSRAIETGYVALDRAIAALLEAVGEDSIVILMSDHGFEGVYKTFYANRWLMEQGYLMLRDRRSGSAAHRVKGALQKVGLWQLVRKARGRIPQADRFRSENLTYAVDIDWDRTRAAFGPNLGININLQGREPRGIVSPGQEYQDLCSELRHALESWRDPETGGRVVEKVLRREEVYHGDAVELAPDLRLIMARGTLYRGRYAYSPKVVAAGPLAYPDRVFGNHAEFGILVACGPGIRPGARIEGAQIVDVAPTILYAMGLPIPESMDGRPLEALFADGFVPTQEDGAQMMHTSSSFAGESTYSVPEEAQVMERLRSLGYLD